MSLLIPYYKDASIDRITIYLGAVLTTFFYFFLNITNKTGTKIALIFGTHFRSPGAFQ